MRAVTDEYYRLYDLMELAQDNVKDELYEEDYEDGAGYGDYDIKPVEKSGKAYDREELWRLVYIKNFEQNSFGLVDNVQQFPLIKFLTPAWHTGVGRGWSIRRELWRWVWREYARVARLNASHTNIKVIP